MVEPVDLNVVRHCTECRGADAVSFARSHRARFPPGLRRALRPGLGHLDDGVDKVAGLADGELGGGCQDNVGGRGETDPVVEFRGDGDLGYVTLCRVASAQVRRADVVEGREDGADVGGSVGEICLCERDLCCIAIVTLFEDGCSESEKGQ